MQEIVILSGKGGTGKTVVLASFAALSRSKVLCDCDVDAADLHLVLQPTVRETHEFWGRPLADIDLETCDRCGLCQEVCRFDAIQDSQVDHFIIAIIPHQSAVAQQCIQYKISASFGSTNILLLSQHRSTISK